MLVAGVPTGVAATMVSRAQPLSADENQELARIGLELSNTPQWKNIYGTPLA